MAGLHQYYSYGKEAVTEVDWLDDLLDSFFGRQVKAFAYARGL